MGCIPDIRLRKGHYLYYKVVNQLGNFFCWSSTAWECRFPGGFNGSLWILGNKKNVEFCHYQLWGNYRYCGIFHPFVTYCVHVNCLCWLSHQCDLNLFLVSWFCLCSSFMYDCLSGITIPLPLSAGLIMISWLFFKHLIALCSSFVRFFCF